MGRIVVVLDTTFLVDVLKKKAPVDLVKGVNTGAYITSISAMELMFGALKSQNKAQEETTMSLLNSFSVLDFDLDSSIEASRIKHILSKSGSMIETEDIMIAAIAKANNQAVVTRNGRHFSRIDGLKVMEY